MITAKRLRKILPLVLACLMAGCAKAPAENSNATNASATDPAPIKSVDVVKATPQQVTLAAGESGEAVVKLEIKNGYHVNANPPSFPYLKATELQITPGDGISVQYMRYPEPLTKKFAFAEKPLAIYEGETTLKASIKADKSTKPGPHNLSAKLSVQACDEAVCYAPGTMDVTVPVNIK
jgi:DsbC/DsbD-like thiol-disulfide interchange protein